MLYRGIYNRAQFSQTAVIIFRTADHESNTIFDICIWSRITFQERNVVSVAKKLSWCGAKENP